MHRQLALVALVGIVSGCGPRGRQKGSSPPAEPAMVVFTNQSMYEAAVFVVPRGGARLRIGTVQPGRTDTLRIRGGAVPTGTALTIVARLLANRQTPTTGPLTLRGSDWIGVTLPPDANILNVLPVP